MSAKTFHIITMGCKINQYESEAIREAWLKAGHAEQSSPNNADLVLINSCAVTARAISDLRNTARRVRKAAPGCQLLITGCAAQALPGELKELPQNGIIGREQKITLLSYLPNANDASADFTSNAIPYSGDSDDESLSNTIRTLIDNTDVLPQKQLSPDAFWENAAPDERLAPNRQLTFPPFSITNYARSRAVLKIHDGCSQYCTYCIVPQGRGPSVSRPWPEALAEASRLINAGFREIIINGINLRQYGLDLPGKPDFWNLMERLEKAFAPEWSDASSEKQRLRFRISSLEPGQLDGRALALLQNSRLIAPQLHLSLQSGSLRTLKRMGRGHYDPSGLPDFLQKLRTAWPVFGLGADFICGFPGETDDDFEATMHLAEALPLTYAHIFPYSARPGTAAAKLPGQIAPAVKKERAARLRAMVTAKKQAFLKTQLALPDMWVAVEEHNEEHNAAHGVNEYYTPCRFAEGAPQPAQSGRALCRVKPLCVADSGLMVESIA